jgi:hypothetical protein
VYVFLFLGSRFYAQRCEASIRDLELPDKFSDIAVCGFSFLFVVFMVFLLYIDRVYVGVVLSFFSSKARVVRCRELKHICSSPPFLSHASV